MGNDSSGQILIHRIPILKSGFIWRMILCLAFMGPVLIQAQQKLWGIPPFQPVQANQEGIMDFNGLSEQILIPVIKKTGRGLPFNYNLLFSTPSWYGPQHSTWYMVGGWQGTQPESQNSGYGTGGVITYQSQVGGPCVYGTWPDLQYWYWTQYTNFTYYGPQGTAHSLNSYEFIDNPNPPCGPSTSTPVHNTLTE